jgi:hypothetical protein
MINEHQRIQNTPRAARPARFNTAHHFGFDAITMKDMSKMVYKEYLDESKGKVPA